MDRLILGVIIVVFCTVVGFLLAKKYRKRKQFFAQLYLFNERFLNELSYYRRPLAECIGQFAYKGEFALLLDLYFECIESGSYLLDVKNNAEFSFLTEEEKNGVIDYFRMLGKGDSASQKTHFSAQQASLQKWRVDAENLAKKYEDLYVKLGFLIGLFLLIILI